MNVVHSTCGACISNLCVLYGCQMTPQQPPAPMGCICPPTSEQTCQGLNCPRRNPFSGLQTGHKLMNLDPKWKQYRPDLPDEKLEEIIQSYKDKPAMPAWVGHELLRREK